MRSFSRVLVLTVLGAVLGGCAMAPPRTLDSTAAQGDLNRLQLEQQQIVRQLDRVQDSLVLMEARMQNQQQRLEEMRALLTAQKVTSGGEMTTAAPPAQPATALPPPSAPANDPVPGHELPATDTYLQSFADYASGRYPQAILGFESFLRRFPRNDYAGNAQYWLGECFLAQQQLSRAADAFQKTFELYPQGSKTPDALLRLAEVQQQMNQPERARATLKSLQERYPNSAAAAKSPRGQ